MRKNHDLGVIALFFKIDDLSIKPSKISLMRLGMRADIPFTDMKKVVEPEANRLFMFERDGRKKTAA